MMNNLQFEKHETAFVEFGKILFIYTFFYIGSIILVSILEYVSSYESLILSTSINSVYITINSVLLFLLFYYAQKIKKQFSLNSSLKIFNTGLLIWFIFYITTSVISLVHPFIPTYRQLYYNMTLTISIFSIGISTIQFMTWYALSSFFRNSDSLVVPTIKNNGHTASKILVTASILGGFGNIINTIIISISQIGNFKYSINIEFLTIVMIIFLLSIAGSFILFVIGSLFLSSNLKKKVINWNSNGLPNRNGPGSVQRFCQYCGYHVESSTKFCPDCGKSLK